MANNSDIRNIEIEKSVDNLIATQNKSRAIKLSFTDARNQYIMTTRFELSRLKKLGFFDVTEEELKSRLDEKMNSNREIEIERSITNLIPKRKELNARDMLSISQYKMAINLEITKLRKSGHLDVSSDMLNIMVDNRIKQEQTADAIIENMENNPIVKTFSRQRGYVMIGILGLATSIITIGIIAYGYIMFFD